MWSIGFYIIWLSPSKPILPPEGEVLTQTTVSSKPEAPAGSAFITLKVLKDSLCTLRTATQPLPRLDVQCCVRLVDRDRVLGVPHSGPHIEPHEQPGNHSPPHQHPYHPHSYHTLKTVSLEIEAFKSPCNFRLRWLLLPAGAAQKFANPLSSLTALQKYRDSCHIIQGGSGQSLEVV